MGVTNKERLILFALGHYSSNTNKRLEETSLEVSLPKHTFIDILKKTRLADTQERTIYKHLENLEKKKLAIYDNRSIKLTTKGMAAFDKINKEFLPYLRIRAIIESDSTARAAKRLQTRFK